MPRHRRHRAPVVPTPRDDRLRRDTPTRTVRLAHLGVLGLYAQILVAGIHFFAIDTKALAPWASYVAAITGIFFLAKLFDESPSASRRRSRARVWSDVHALVRDGLRIISIGSMRVIVSSPTASPAIVSPRNGSPETTPKQSPNSSPRASTNALEHDTPRTQTLTLPDNERVEELLGILAAFPITLQHHLLGTRALPHAPLSDLLPPEYLTSLKRTEARVRFAAAHAGPSGSGSPQKPIDGSRLHANGGKVAASEDEPDADVATPKKSNLHAGYPSNLPVSLLRLLEAYIIGFSELPADRGWSPLQSTRAFKVVKGLNATLSEAESVYADPRPLIDVRLTLNIFLFTLPLWLVCKARGWLAILMTMIAGSLAKFVLEAVLSEPDPTLPNSPLHQTTLAMLHEALDTCPSLARYYRARLVARLGSDAQEVLELDRRNRRRDEWLPSFP